MAKEIIEMSKKFGGYIGSIGKKMMVRYANEDWNFDIEEYVDNILYKARLEPEKDLIRAKHILNYWKYKFLLAQGNKESAMRCLLESYKEMGPDAIAQVAYFYYTGQEVTKLVNRQKAKRLFKDALEQDSMFAEYLIAEAIVYKNENNVNELKKAIPYYEKALAKGVIFARYNLANCYIKTNQNLDVAEELLKKCDDKLAISCLEKLKQNKKKRS